MTLIYLLRVKGALGTITRGHEISYQSGFWQKWWPASYVVGGPVGVHGEWYMCAVMISHERWFCFCSAGGGASATEGEEEGLMATALLTSGSRREGRSGSRRETMTETLKCRKIGCMSGILHLLHSPSRKRLTLAKNQDKTVTSPTKPKSTPHKIKSPARTSSGKKTRTIRASDIPPPDGTDLRRFSCDVPRSPTITPDIRRCNSINSPETLRRPPALVARLMGLDDFPAEESPAEKRRKLITALQKCDEDLKALKRIIEAARESDDQRRRLTASGEPESAKRENESNESPSVSEKSGASSGSTSVSDGESSTTLLLPVSETCSEQPSPVSVLDGAIFSPVADDNTSSPTTYSDKGDVRCGSKAKEEPINRIFFHVRSAIDEPSVRVYHREEDEPFRHLVSTTAYPRRISYFWGSKEKTETVNEVWKDGVWEEKWELGRICVSLEGHILGGLVEETITELGCSIPLDKCRKRLIF
ncbi:hypothetical protein H6P81_007835 [Aristolochia fimbriata]|uniref:DUF3741 domain-containing protein n=1 Tax=Aristolochia fimbriata TaxID=158543 RepID=A0AAV7F470_ARIFI|nr:hypothetical protein H6P81_007835 [Aristolochia fimbriata]